MAPGRAEEATLLLLDWILALPRRKSPQSYSYRHCCKTHTGHPVTGQHLPRYTKPHKGCRSLIPERQHEVEASLPLSRRSLKPPRTLPGGSRRQGGGHRRLTETLKSIETINETYLNKGIVPSVLQLCQRSCIGKDRIVVDNKGIYSLCKTSVVKRFVISL